MPSRRRILRTSLTATVGLIVSAADVAQACPKCRLGAAALTGSQNAAAPVDWIDSLVTNVAAPGGTPTTAPTAAETTASENAWEGRLSISGGLSFTTAYYHRGYLQENKGVIAQPFLTLGCTFGDAKSLAVTPYVGTWNSFHDEHTYTDGDFDAWYESETMLGAVLSRGPVSLDVQYKLYSYPNGALSQIEEVSAKLSADLVQLIGHKDRPGDVVLLGWVQLAKEISDRNEPPTSTSGTQQMQPAHAPIFHVPDAGDGGNDGFDTSGQGFYMELGLEPSWRTKVGKVPIGLSVPLILGTSLDGYFQQAGGSNEFLGYASAGVQVTVPLDVPERFGKWYLSGSVTYLHLLADSAKFANGGQEQEVFGAVGISFLH